MPVWDSHGTVLDDGALLVGQASEPSGGLWEPSIMNVMLCGVPMLSGDPQVVPISVSLWKKKPTLVMFPSVRFRITSAPDRDPAH